MRPETEVPEEAENIFFPFDPAIKAAGAWLNGKPPEPEGRAEAAAVPGSAPNVNTPEGLLFVKLKFAALLPNWKTEPEFGAAEEPNPGWLGCCPNTGGWLLPDTVPKAVGTG